MPRFCPTCGKTIASGDFCAEHTPKAAIALDHLDVLFCPECGRHFSQGIWHPAQPLKQLLGKLLEAKIKKKVVITLPKDLAEEEHNFTVDVRLQKGESREISIKLLPNTCDKCGVKGSKYFEGVLQLRGLSDKQFDVVEAHLADEEEKQRFIMKEVHVGDDGYDLYVSSNKLLSSMARKLKSMGAVITKSHHLYSRDSFTSKDLKRGTVLAVFPDIKEGDVIDLDNQPVRVIQVKHPWKGVSLSTGKTIKIPETTKIIKVEQRRTNVSSVNPSVHALDPETYQQLKLENAPELKNSEKVVVVKYQGKLYFVEKA